MKKVRLRYITFFFFLLAILSIVLSVKYFLFHKVYFNIFSYTRYTEPTLSLKLTEKFEQHSSYAIMSW